MTDIFSNFNDLAKALQPANNTRANPPGSPGSGKSTLPIHDRSDHRDGYKNQLSVQKNNLEHQVAELRRKSSSLHVAYQSLERRNNDLLSIIHEREQQVKELSGLLGISTDTLLAVGRDRELVEQEKIKLAEEKIQLSELQSLLNKQIESAKEQADKIINDARGKYSVIEKEADDLKRTATKIIDHMRRNARLEIVEKEKESRSELTRLKLSLQEKLIKVGKMERMLEPMSRKCAQLHKENMRLREQLALASSQNPNKLPVANYLLQSDWANDIDIAFSMGKSRMTEMMAISFERLKNELTAKQMQYDSAIQSIQELTGLCRMACGVDDSSSLSEINLFFGLLGSALCKNAALCRKILGPRVVIAGSLPLPKSSLNDLLQHACVEACSVDQDCETWIVGHLGWSNHDFNKLFNRSSSYEVRVYTHELLFASLACGEDLYDSHTHEEMYAMSSGHPALKYLYDHGFDWSRKGVEAQSA